MDINELNKLAAEAGFGGQLRNTHALKIEKLHKLILSDVFDQLDELARSAGYLEYKLLDAFVTEARFRMLG